MENILYFDFYGVALRVECRDSETRENIRRDFSYFFKESQSKTHIKISIYFEKPPFEKVPPLKASLYNPDSLAYDDRHIRYVDHQARALTIYDYKNETGQIYAQDKKLLHELSYLLMLSRVGELLDKRGIHRIHALGICVKERGVLCLLPQGAGKTTLALDLLKVEDIKLLSDDTTLIKRNGELLAFPLRLGVSGDFPLDIPSEYLREFKRRKYGTKTLIDIDYFKDKIISSVKLSIILIGQRISSGEAKIVKLNKMRAIGPIIRDAVIGLGLAQMVEYFLRFDFKDIFSKIGIIFSRLRVSFKLLLHSKSYCFLIGGDRAKNVEVLLSFLEREQMRKNRKQMMEDGQ